MSSGLHDVQLPVVSAKNNTLSMVLEFKTTSTNGHIYHSLLLSKDTPYQNGQP